MGTWVDACGTDDVELEDVIRFAHGGKVFAIIRSPEDAYHCIDGICSHEHVDLSGGLVMDNVIECPKHNGQFDYRTGEAVRAPVCIDLKAYPTKVENGRVLVEI